MNWVFITIGAIPVAISIGSYLYLLLTNKDYLRSEEFHIQKFSMEMLGEKGAEFHATADHFVEIAKPPRLVNYSNET